MRETGTAEATIVRAQLTEYVNVLKQHPSHIYRGMVRKAIFEARALLNGCDVENPHPTVTNLVESLRASAGAFAFTRSEEAISEAEKYRAISIGYDLLALSYGLPARYPMGYYYDNQLAYRISFAD